MPWRDLAAAGNLVFFHNNCLFTKLVARTKHRDSRLQLDSDRTVRRCGMITPDPDGITRSGMSLLTARSPTHHSIPLAALREVHSRLCGHGTGGFSEFPAFSFYDDIRVTILQRYNSLQWVMGGRTMLSWDRKVGLLSMGLMMTVRG